MPLLVRSSNPDIFVSAEAYKSKYCTASEM